MFLPSFEDLRRFVLETTTIVNLAHLGPRAFGAISGEVVQTVAFSLSGRHIAAYVPSFVRAVDGDEDCKAETLRTLKNTYSNLKTKRSARNPWLADCILGVSVPH